MEGWLSQPRFWDVTWSHSRPRCQIAALLLGARLHQPCPKGMWKNGQQIVHPENTKWFSWTQKGHFYGSTWRLLISPFVAWIGFTQTRFILALIECPIQRNHVGQKAKTEQNKTKPKPQPSRGSAESEELTNPVASFAIHILSLWQREILNLSPYWFLVPETTQQIVIMSNSDNL